MIRAGLRPSGVAAVGAAAAYYLFMSSRSQLLGPVTWRAPVESKVVALTFDDGPNEPFTSQILSILDDHDAVGTFFMVGRNIESSPEVVRRIAASAHELGNHSLNHQFRRYFFGDRTYAREIRGAQEAFRRIAGVAPTLFRPPWLYRTPSILYAASAMGLRTISGEFAHGFEVFQPKGDRIARAALRKVRPGSIIIFHDGFNARRGANRAETVRAVELVVAALAENGWRMVTVSQLLDHDQTPRVADRHHA